MPESNAVTEESNQPTVARRLIATLVDAAVVATPTSIVALAASERFSILDRVDGTPIFSEPDQLRINEIDKGFNRAIRLGDTVFALSGSGWWLTFATLLALTVAVFVALPLVLRRRSPGRLLLGVPVRSEHTDRDEPAELVSVEAALKGTGYDSATAAAEDTADPDPGVATERGHTDSSNGSDGTVSGHGAAPIPDSLIGSTMPGADDETDGRPDDEQLPGSTVERLRGVTQAQTGTAASDPTDDQDDMTTTSDKDQDRPAPNGDLAGATEPPPPVTLADADDYLDWERPSVARPRRSSAPNNGAGSGFEVLALPESSLAELPIHASTVAARAALNSDTTPEDQPIWNDAWNAWIYWDRGSGRWFRHDPAESRWRPMEPSRAS